MAEKKWVQKTGRFENGRKYFYNKIEMGSWNWDGGGPPLNEKGEKLHYHINTPLPSIKLKNTSFLTQEEAEQYVEIMVGIWIDWAGLKES